MKKIFNNIYILTAINKFSTCFFGLLSTIFINRYMGPSLKGEYAIILNTISICAIVGNLGIYQAYPNFKRKHINNLLSKFVNIFYIQFIILILMSIVLYLLLKSYNIFMLVIIPIMVFVNQLNFISMVENPKYRNITNILNAILKCVYCCILFFMAPRNIYIAFTIVLIPELFLLVMYLIKLKVKPNFKLIDFKFFFSVLKFGIIPMLIMLFLNINYKIDVIMLGSIAKDVALVGIYSVGAGLAEYVWIIPDIFKEVLFSKTAVDDSIKDVKMSLKLSNIFIILLSVIVLIIGKLAIKMLYGIEFVDSYYVTTMLIVGTLPMSWYKILNTLYLAQGRRKIMFNTLLISAISNILLNLILIPKFGLNGAAIASIVSYTLCGIPVIYTFCRKYKIPFISLFYINKKEIKIVIKKIKSRSKLSNGNM